MPEPCSARCMNQRKNLCRLDDERIRQSRVEFGEDWDPANHCVGYLPRDKKKSDRKSKE